jgi:DNA-binding NarL/FixJ family response regulator
MKPVECYITPEGEISIRPAGGVERQLKESDTAFIQEILAYLKEFYPDAFDALMEIYAKSAANRRYRDFLAVRRLLKCNFSLYDNSIDIDERMKFKFEFVGCPLRGECKYDRTVCFPAFNSKLSERETAVMRMLYDGKTDAEAAEELFISINTVNSHRKNSFRKLEIHSMPEFMRYAQSTGLFNGKR